MGSTTPTDGSNSSASPRRVQPPSEPSEPGPWGLAKSLAWEPLRIERVVEVGYNHVRADRFRHPSHFKRWRDDKAASDCTLEQLDVTAPYELQRIFSQCGLRPPAAKSRDGSRLPEVLKQPL